jgi:very-short-patch-repair endonuclease
MRRVRGVPDAVRDAACELRRTPTSSEALLWSRLRQKQLGARFRTQHALGRFILDFYCVEARLAIELDGGIHEAQQERDRERDAALRAAGLRVLRFSNEDVDQRLDAVVAEIARALG